MNKKFLLLFSKRSAFFCSCLKKEPKSFVHFCSSTSPGNARRGARKLGVAGPAV
jgi:hypothetical protein